MERGRSARDIGAKIFQNWRTQRKTTGDKVETRKFGMWKMGSVERSPKSLINIKNTFYKKVLEESGAVFFFSKKG